MERRSFFQLIFGALLEKWFPKSNPNIPRPLSGNAKRVMDEMFPVITDAENVVFDGCVVRALDPSKPHNFTIQYVKRNGYVTPPSPLYFADRTNRLASIPVGPPGTKTRILSFD